MVEKYRCRVNLDVIATKWMKHGDSQHVIHVPDHINVDVTGVNKSDLGMLGNNIFAPGAAFIIECGGNVFVVDEAYFREYYEVVENLSS